MFRNIIFSFFMLVGSSVQGQVAGDSLSLRIADRLRDSLGLTVVQRDSLYLVNQYLANEKLTRRAAVLEGQNLQRELQLVENMRDSLYQIHLSPMQFETYRSRKKFLIRAH